MMQKSQDEANRIVSFVFGGTRDKLVGMDRLVELCQRCIQPTQALSCAGKLQFIILEDFLYPDLNYEFEYQGQGRLQGLFW